MTTDMAVFSTSPWQNDSWLPKDLLGQDEPMSSLEANIDYSSVGHRRGQSLLGSPSTVSGYCSPSLGGSECSDDIMVDEDDQLHYDDTEALGDIMNWGLDGPEGDIMQQTMLSILGETPLTEDDHVISLDLPEPPILQSMNKEAEPVSSDSGAKKVESRPGSSAGEAVIPSAPSSPCPQQCQRRRSKHTPHTRPWGELSKTEQLAVAEELSASISEQLGLREQLEVISIINPAAAVRPADTEFVIELSWLTESKLRQVYDYLDRHQRKTHLGNSRHGNSSSSGNKSSGSSPQQHDHGRVSKRSKGRRGVQQREVRQQRDQKEERQVKKEARSGLFKREEVVALSSCEHDSSEEEIDILT